MVVARQHFGPADGRAASCLGGAVRSGVPLGTRGDDDHRWAGRGGPAVNRPSAPLSGHERWPLAELGFAKLVHHARHARGARREASPAGADVIVVQWRHADGHDVWLRITMTELDMSVPGVVCVITDVTSQLNGRGDAGAGVVVPLLVEGVRHLGTGDRLVADP